MTLFALGLLPLLVALGFWQLDRAALKRSYEDRYFERMGQPARAAPGDLDDLENAAFLRVRLTGHFDRARYFLLDNQVSRGRQGYWVLGLFDGADGRRWLVNRGWVAAAPSRGELPVVDAPAGEVEISGVLWPDTGLLPLLAADPWAADWPKRVQRLDLPALAAAGGLTHAVEVRLESGQPGILEPVAQRVDFKSSTHQGYAVQWFGLAIVLAVGYVIYGFRKHD